MMADPLTPAEAVAIAAVLEAHPTATGTTNASAEKHTNELKHVTTTEVRA